MRMAIAAALIASVATAAVAQVTPPTPFEGEWTMAYQRYGPIAVEEQRGGSFAIVDVDVGEALFSYFADGETLLIVPWETGRFFDVVFDVERARSCGIGTTLTFADQQLRIHYPAVC